MFFDDENTEEVASDVEETPAMDDSAASDDSASSDAPAEETSTEEVA